MRGEGIKWLLFLVLSFLVVSSIASVTAPVTVPLVYVDPSVSTANPGEAFNINVNILNVVDLFSWGIKLRWNPNVLEVAWYMIGTTKKYNVTEGPFLKTGTTSPSGTSFVAKVYIDYLDAGCVTLGYYPGVSGSGTLMTVTFRVKDSGKSALEIFTSTLLDSTITPITHTAQNGSFYTTASADLVGKSAWPEHHHFVISKDEGYDGTYANQTLFGKVSNIGPLPLDVYVTFDLVRDDGFIVPTIKTEEVVIAPGATVDLTAIFTLSNADVGKYMVNASAWYSWSGFYFTQGDKIKPFSFAVVP